MKTVMLIIVIVMMVVIGLSFIPEDETMVDAPTNLKLKAVKGNETFYNKIGVSTSPNEVVEISQEKAPKKEVKQEMTVIKKVDNSAKIKRTVDIETDAVKSDPAPEPVAWVSTENRLAGPSNILKPSVLDNTTSIKYVVPETMVLNCFSGL